MGIGTDNPDNKLHLYDSTTNRIHIQAPNDNPAVLFTDAGDEIMLDSSEKYNFKFQILQIQNLQ